MAPILLLCHEGPLQPSALRQILDEEAQADPHADED
jgi:hypothetical protein